MEPTFFDGNIIVVDTSEGNYDKGDIILFKTSYGPQKTYIKRIIGMPGDEVRAIGGCVFINGVIKKEAYVYDQYASNCHTLVDYPIIPRLVKKDRYFVLGDNRDNSFDSRGFGCIEKKNIKGKALYVLLNVNKTQ